jgi:hypothetical protein
MTADEQLMHRIRTHWAAQISAACSTSSVPPEFLAALIANESGGDNENPPRFEPGVYRHLAAVQKGTPSPGDVLRHRPAHFGAIQQRDLEGFTDDDLRGLASSWGLTQVMWYHLLSPLGRAAAAPKLLLGSAFNLHEALRLLAGFAQEFQLDLRIEYEELFRCWNTGRPDGATFDPRYVENGLRRLESYKASRGVEESKS